MVTSKRSAASAFSQDVGMPRGAARFPRGAARLRGVSRTVTPSELVGETVSSESALRFLVELRFLGLGVFGSVSEASFRFSVLTLTPLVFFLGVLGVVGFDLGGVTGSTALSVDTLSFFEAGCLGVVGAFEEPRFGVVGDALGLDAYTWYQLTVTRTCKITSISVDDTTMFGVKEILTLETSLP